MRNFVALLFMLVSFLNSEAQNNPAVVLKPITDTLETYAVNLRALISTSQEEYFVGNKKVPKQEYLRFKSKVENIGRCTPCYLKTYDENDRLIREGVQYMDCGVGKFVEYFPNGHIKQQGQFKENITGNWLNLYERNYCSVAVGTWYNYYDDSSVYSIEKYVNGKLIANTE